MTRFYGTLALTYIIPIVIEGDCGLGGIDGGTLLIGEDTLCIDFDKTFRPPLPG